MVFEKPHADGLVIIVRSSGFFIMGSTNFGRSHVDDGSVQNGGDGAQAM
jgi:hypothetical protein